MARRGQYARRGGSGPPAWLVFLIAIALVFGVYYLIRGVQNFVRTGGMGADEATRQAQTAVSQVNFSTPTVSGGMSILPTWTPQIACTDFRVSVPNAIVRQQPSSNGAIITGLDQGTVVCVIRREPPDGEWYLIDLDPQTRRLNEAYMNEQVIEAVNPTATPSRTFTPLPTVTPAPSQTIIVTHTPNTDFRPTLPSANLAGDTPPAAITSTLQPMTTLTPQPPEALDEGLPNG